MQTRRTFCGMKYAALVLLSLATGCAFDPVGAINLPPEAQRTCDYVGAMHGNDGYGGIGPRAACMRYVRDTGRLPPDVRS